MICVIAGNRREAAIWARSQELHDSEWFYPETEDTLHSKQDFHVIVVGTAGENVPISYFNRIYLLAKRRGRLKL